MIATFAPPAPLEIVSTESDRHFLLSTFLVPLTDGRYRRLVVGNAEITASWRAHGHTDSHSTWTGYLENRVAGVAHNGCLRRAGAPREKELSDGGYVLCIGWSRHGGDVTLAQIAAIEVEFNLVGATAPWPK
jgi:hypothetical protein